MRVLGIETSGDVCGAAVADAQGELGSIQFRHGKALSRLLVPTLGTLLEMVGLERAGLEGIAVSLGPGSFTGLRIGVATAKTLAWSLDLPVVGVPTLEALAAACPVAGALACPVLAASAGRLYAGLYGVAGEEIAPLWTPAARAPEELTRLLQEQPGTIWLTGASDSVREPLRAALGERLLLNEFQASSPPAALIARLGRRRLLRGEMTAAEPLAPLYLTLSTAEERRQEAIA